MRIQTLVTCVLLSAVAQALGQANEPSSNLPPITSADWSTYNHDARGWRFNSAEETLSAANASKLEEKWRFPAQGSTEQVGVIHATPTVVNGHSYFGTATYPAFYKLQPDGTLAWVYRLATGQSRTKPLLGFVFAVSGRLFVRDRTRPSRF